MDAMRKQLDVLMGTNRNGDVREVNRKYFDRDVCRLFLAGLCPHDLCSPYVSPPSLPFPLARDAPPPPLVVIISVGEAVVLIRLD